MVKIHEEAAQLRQSPRNNTAAIEVAERLRADILSCKYPPGSKLRFESLQKDYGVGLGPLRVALSQLVTTRLVTSAGQRGFRVVKASIADITDIAMVRTQIEVQALAKSIEQGGDAWEAEVVAIRHRLALIEGRSSRQPVNEEEWEQRHREFHTALISACRSPWLMYMAEHFRICGNATISPKVAMAR